MQVRTYRAASRELLAKAKQELARGDLRQASEKAWGTAAQMVKAIAEQRGWHHDNHRYFFGIVGQLADETDDRSLANHFHIANSLHTNFYEDVMPETMMEAAINEVGQLLDKLEPLLD